MIIFEEGVLRKAILSIPAGVQAATQPCKFV
jgi:hypothetical protein